MKRRIFKEDKKAVSPVIATILMVAITVVLAATLYMMIDTGDEGGQLVAGSINDRTEGTRLTAYEDPEESGYQAHVRIDMTLRTPGSALEDDLSITVLDAGGEEVGAAEGDDRETATTWSLLEDDRVVSGSRLRVTVTGLEEGDSIRNYEVIIRVSGYEGNLATTLG